MFEKLKQSNFFQGIQNCIADMSLKNKENRQSLFLSLSTYWVHLKTHIPDTLGTNTPRP